MAKYEAQFRGDFYAVLEYLDRGILRGSFSASYEDGSDWNLGENVRCAVRVYERYSAMGSNRVSLTLTLLGDGDKLFLSAITAGSSQAVLFKMNTVGEMAFLNRLQSLVESL